MGELPNQPFFAKELYASFGIHPEADLYQLAIVLVYPYMYCTAHMLLLK
jgi:hypothetical protein